MRKVNPSKINSGYYINILRYTPKKGREIHGGAALCSYFTIKRHKRLNFSIRIKFQNVYI